MQGSFLDDERRRARLIGVVATVAAILFVAAQLVSSSALSDIDFSSEAERLTAYHDKPAEGLFIPGAMQGLAFLLMTIPVAYLFRAAANRAPNLQRTWLGLVFLGAVLTATGLLLTAAGQKRAADDFAKEERTSWVAPVTVQAGGSDQAETKTETVAPEPKPESAPSADDESDEASEDPDDRAQDLIEDNGGAGAAALLAGFLAFGIGFAVTCFWALRTGLLTRFAGSAGIGVGVLTAVPFFSQMGVFGLALMMVFFSVFFLRSPAHRPPAWEAGRAIPWPRPGDPPDGPGSRPGPEDTLEGEGRDVTEPRPPSGPPPRKRKRRE
jgi:drug/metabolite transporter (DMT)-like permease